MRRPGGGGPMNGGCQTLRGIILSPQEWGRRGCVYRLVMLNSLVLVKFLKTAFFK